MMPITYARGLISEPAKPWECKKAKIQFGYGRGTLKTQNPCALTQGFGMANRDFQAAVPSSSKARATERMAARRVRLKVPSEMYSRIMISLLGLFSR